MATIVAQKPSGVGEWVEVKDAARWEWAMQCAKTPYQKELLWGLHPLFFGAILVVEAQWEGSQFEAQVNLLRNLRKDGIPVSIRYDLQSGKHVLVIG